MTHPRRHLGGTALPAAVLSALLVAAIAAFAVYSKHRRAEILAADAPAESVATDAGADIPAPVESASAAPAPTAAGVAAKGVSRIGPPDSRGCYKPAPPEQLPSTPEVAVMVDALSRAVAKGYWGVDAGKPTDTPEQMAADLQKRLAERQAHPSGRLQSCMERVGAVRMANPKRPLIDCIHTIDVCADDRGGPGCCPRACIEKAQQLCAGGKCADPGREIFVTRALWKGECVPGYAQAFAAIDKMGEEASRRQARQSRDLHAFVYAGANGVLVANRPDGLARSSDDGLTWTAINAGLEARTVRSVALGPAGQLFAAASSEFVRWSETERRWQSLDFRTLGGPQSIQQIVIDGGGRLIIHDGYFAWVSPDEGTSWRKLPETGPRKMVTTIALSPDGRLITATSGDQPIARWRGVDAWDLLPLGQHVGSVEHIWPLPDGRLVVTGDRTNLIAADGVVVPSAPPSEQSQGTIYTAELRYILAVAAGHGRIYALRSGVDAPLIRSLDGVTWTPVRTMPGCGEPSPGKRGSCDVRGIAVTRRGTVILATSRQLLRSTDDGDTWKVVRENE